MRTAVAHLPHLGNNPKPVGTRNIREVISRMVPPNKARGISKMPDLDLSKYISTLDGIPDDNSLGRLQGALETLISARSHPMVVALQKQLERLKTAESVVDHEISTRKARSDSVNSSDNPRDDSQNRKRLRSDSWNEFKDAPSEFHPADENKSNTAGKKQDKDTEATSETLETNPQQSTEDGQTKDTEATDATEDAGVATNVSKEEENTDVVESQSLPADVELKKEENIEDNNKEDDPNNQDSTHQNNEETGKENNETDLQREQLSPKSAEKPNEESTTNSTEANSQTSSEPAVSSQPSTSKPQNEDSTTTEKLDTETEQQQVNVSQEDAVRPGNSKFLLNPKSEFVTTQSFPVHAMGIFNEEKEDENDEEYKMRLGVVSYPKEDLFTLTAGPVPMEDFTRSKPTNQIQFQTYSTFLEPYFRPFTDEDLQFLQSPNVTNTLQATNLRTGQKLSSYAFPPLGPHYHQQWAQQDAEISGVELSESSKKSNSVEIEALKRQYKVYGSIDNVTDKILETSINDVQNLGSDNLTSSKGMSSVSSTVGGSSSNGGLSSSTSGKGVPSNETPRERAISLGPFTERLVAAIMPEIYDTNQLNGSAKAEDSEPQVFEKSASLIPSIPNSHIPPVEDFAHLEERIKDEFRYVGVFDMALLRKFESQKNQFKLADPESHEGMDAEINRDINIDWVNGAEDDEISRELRFLQRKLKEVSSRNEVYKRRLIPVMQEQLSWQEYQSILTDLDKQVDQAYMKRLKAPRGTIQAKYKKRKLSSDSPFSAESLDNGPSDDKLVNQKPMIKALMEKRERWISKIGPLFRPAYQMMREYERPKFKDMDKEMQDEEEEEEGDKI